MDVRAYHLILTCYGFWLRNDPRGSWSDFVRSFELYRAAGKATCVHTKQSVAHRAHDHDARLRAKRALKRPSVILTGTQARAVTQGFADYVEKNHRRVYACAVMPDHAHLVVARCDRTIETLGDQLKARATMFLNRKDLHPFAGEVMANGRPPTPWSRKSWSAFLSTDDSIQRAIDYVNKNPIKAGYKPQHYDWVTEFKG